MRKQNIPQNLTGPRKKKARKKLMVRYNKAMQALATIEREAKHKMLSMQGYRHKLKLVDSNKGTNSVSGIPETSFTKLIA